MTACPEHAQTLPCTNCAGDHLAGEHLFGSHHETCARCAEIATDRPEPDVQHLAAADDTLDSPNDDEGDPR